MARTANFFYRLEFRDLPAVVHRGVSQMKVSRKQRRKPEPRETSRLHNLWQRKKVSVPGITVMVSDDQGDPVVVKVTPEALRAMKEKNLVIVGDSEKPQTWSPNRIKKQAEKIRLL